MSPEYEYPKPEHQKEEYENWDTPRSLEEICSTEDEPKTERMNTDIGEVAVLNFYGGEYPEDESEKEGQEEIENHDSLFVFEDERYVYLTVIDGMGGHEKAGEFSEGLTEKMQDKLKSEKGPTFSLAKVFSDLQKEMEGFPAEDAGAVVTTTMIDKKDGAAEIANLGDSRSAIIDNDGEIKTASKMQTAAAEAYGQKEDQKVNQITRDFLKDFLISHELNLRNNIVIAAIDSRKGVDPHKTTEQPDTNRSSVESGDFIILGSDGIINEALTVSEIAQEIQKDPEQSADELRDKILKKMKSKLEEANKDNIDEITTVDEEREEMEIPAEWAEQADNMSLIILKNEKGYGESDAQQEGTNPEDRE